MERYKKLMGIKKGKDMIELPPIPEGDRFKDTSLFRPLGTGQKSRLYECWDDAIYEYARTHGDKRAAEAREQMREECIKACQAAAGRGWSYYEEERRPVLRGKALGADVCVERIKELP